ncbi:MAG: ribonuclease III domain-containing protein [Oscillospiraceae bacterium]
MESLLQAGQNPKQMSPLALAFLGDAVYELLVRERLSAAGSKPAHLLHAQAVQLVRASAQSRAYERLLPMLDEEELAVLSAGATPTHVGAQKRRRGGISPRNRRGVAFGFYI